MEKLSEMEALSLIKEEYIQSCEQLRQDISEDDDYYDEDEKECLMEHLSTCKSKAEECTTLPSLLKCIRVDGNYDEDDAEYIRLLFQALVSTEKHPLYIE